MNPGGARLFWWSAAGALGLHAALLATRPALQGGADLRPHLRLIQLMGEDAALRSVYPPAYHALGALLSPLLGIAAYPRVFAFLSAAGLIGGFRYFQRAARLPDATAALFAAVLPSTTNPESAFPSFGGRKDWWVRLRTRSEWSLASNRSVSLIT